MVTIEKEIKRNNRRGTFIFGAVFGFLISWVVATEIIDATVSPGFAPKMWCMLFKTTRTTCP